jgi:hypothetical protein
MNNKLFFLILSSAMIAFTIISLLTVPIMNGNICYSGIGNCQQLVDTYDEKKDSYDDNKKKREKLKINECKRENAMHNLEYTSLIFDAIAGSLCCIFGILHYCTDQNFAKITGIIGLASGGIGFIFTIVYLGYSTYVFNNHHSGLTLLYDNGAKYKWDGSKYATPWTSEDLDIDEKANYVKYRHVGKKQYNYNSELYKIYLENGQHESQNCNTGSGDPPNTQISGCDYIWPNNYLSSQTTNYVHKYLYDTWLTSIIFIIFTLLSEIGVAVFGLLLFLNKGESNHVPLK